MQRQEIYPILLKQQSIGIITTASCCKLHYMEFKKCCKIANFTEKLLDEMKLVLVLIDPYRNNYKKLREFIYFANSTNQKMKGP